MTTAANGNPATLPSFRLHLSSVTSAFKQQDAPRPLPNSCTPHGLSQIVWSGATHSFSTSKPFSSLASPYFPIQCKVQVSVKNRRGFSECLHRQREMRWHSEACSFQRSFSCLRSALLPHAKFFAAVSMQGAPKDEYTALRLQYHAQATPSISTVLYIRVNYQCCVLAIFA